MAIPTGSKGELIASLIAAITGIPEEQWIDAASYAAFAIGGQPLEFSPAPDRIPTANTLGAEEFIAGRTLARDPYMDLLRTRLSDLVDEGLQEDFLVLSVAQEISRQLNALANMTDVNSKRAESRRAIERHILNPARFRAYMGTKDPSYLELTDKDVVARLTKLLRSAAPAGREEELARLEQLNQWETVRTEFLAPSIVETWAARSR